MGQLFFRRDLLETKYKIDCHLLVISTLGYFNSAYAAHPKLLKAKRNTPVFREEFKRVDEADSRTLFAFWPLEAMGDLPWSTTKEMENKKMLYNQWDKIKLVTFVKG
jgi:hypothetical protein